jgi:hypothetical protein
MTILVAVPALAVTAPDAEPNTGLAVGVGLLIGIITGAMFVLLLLQIATAAKSKLAKHIGAAISEVLALPMFWFGGPWLTGQLLSNSGLDAAVDYYVLTLASGFLVVIGYPLMLLVLRTAHNLRKV